MKLAALIVLGVAPGCFITPSGADEDAPTGTPIAVLAAAQSEAFPGQSIRLTGSDSYDPDNAAPAPPHGISAFNWSTTIGTISANGAEAELVLGEGESTVVLVVVDEDGNESDPASVVVTGLPIPETAGIRARLEWELPDLQTAVDLDLVLKNPSFPSDPCNAGTASGCNVAWGAVATREGVGGFNAEQIDVASPSAGIDYLVAVFCWSETSVGETGRLIVSTSEQTGAVFDFTCSKVDHETPNPIAEVQWPSGAVVILAN